MARRKNNAFTLIEILVVVILVGIMAAIVIPQFTGAADDARQSAEDMNLQILQKAVDLFQYDNGAWPADLAALVTNGYIRSVPAGNWGYDNTTGIVTAP
jgi:general secretion pathway protein G